MERRRPLVLLGFLGVQLDSPRTRERFSRWRPTVALCQQEDLLVDRFELWVEERYAQLADLVTADIAKVSPSTVVRRHALGLTDAWDFEQVFVALRDFAQRYPFDPEREDYLVHVTTGTHVAQICLFLLTETRWFPARLIQAEPPRGSEGSVVGSHSIVDLDLSRFDAIAQRFRREHVEATALLKSGIPTRSPSFNAKIDLIERVAGNTKDPILLLGPTGAGKSLLARRIHELKQQRRQIDGEFVEVNCATLRGDSAASALFGHARGAFTGAVSARPGLLRTADRGLLFLDEIGELGIDEQAMLLRALEERRFLPVGADREVSSDFLLIAGTNRDLRAEVARGRFRDDLLARIDLWAFELPGLRDRLEDLEPNVDFELERHAARTGRKVSFNKEARAAYLRFAMSSDAAWRGNFRDLSSSITRLATLAEGGRIHESLVLDEIARLRAAWRHADSHADSHSDPDALRERGDEDLLGSVLGTERLATIDLFDRAQLACVVRCCRRARSASEAGRALFAASRRQRSSVNDADRVRKYLARFGLSFQSVHGDMV